MKPAPRSLPHEIRIPGVSDAPDVRPGSRHCVGRFFDSLPGPAWVKDVTGRYVYVNDAFVRALALSREEIHGRTDEELLPPETAAACRRGDDKVLASGASVRSIDDLELGGVRRHLLVVRFPIAGGVTQIGGLALDVSDRMSIEQELRRAIARKREFLATVAHELRNPLAPIMTALNILEYQGGHSPEVERLHDVIRRQARLMSHLIEDLMDASRAASGKIQLRRCAANLVPVLQAALELSKPQIEAMHHELHCTLPDEALPILADSRRLTQVFSNLLNNAAKFTPEGGRITLTVVRGAESVEVVIRDNGIGIPAEALPRIFDLFAQASEGLERTHGGLGVGLALVKRLVELHHGTVIARSDGPGRGAEFVVRLPLLQPGRASNEDAERAPGTVERVLVVDDDKETADGLGELLTMLGAEARVAYDGAAALELFEAFHPSMVFLDLGLPGMDGIEVAARLRAKRSDLTLVAVTAWSDDETRRRTREAGFDYHLVKPVETESLRALFQVNP